MEMKLRRRILGKLLALAMAASLLIPVNGLGEFGSAYANAQNGQTKSQVTVEKTQQTAVGKPEDKSKLKGEKSEQAKQAAKGKREDPPQTEESFNINHVMTSGSIDTMQVRKSWNQGEIVHGTTVETKKVEDGREIDVFLPADFNTDYGFNLSFNITQNAQEGEVKLPFISRSNNETDAVDNSLTDLNCRLVNGRWCKFRLYVYDHVPTEANNKYECFYIRVFVAENEKPKIKDGIENPVDINLLSSKKYDVDLDKIFVDPDGRNDDLKYRVSVNGGQPVETGAKYTYTPDSAGDVQLKFTATDEKSTSDPYVVNLKVKDPLQVETKIDILRNVLSKVSLYAINDENKENDLLAGNAPDGNVSTITLQEGESYVLEAFDKFGNSVGTVRLDIKDQSATYRVSVCYNLIPKNEGWEEDKDYKVAAKSKSPDGIDHNATFGNFRANGDVEKTKSFLALGGDMAEVTYTPIGTKKLCYKVTTPSAEAPADEARNISDAWSVEIEAKGFVTFKAPADSTVELGRMYGYFVFDFEDDVESTENPDGTVSFKYPFAPGTEFFYKVSNPKGVTYWDYGRWKDGDTVEITKEQLFIDDDSFTKKSHLAFDEGNVCDVGSMFIGLNMHNYLPLDRNKSFTLNVFRDWFPIKDFMNDHSALPDMHYQVIDQKGNPSDLVKVTPGERNPCVAEIKAGRKTGTAIILISYDAMYCAKTPKVNNFAMMGGGGEKYTASLPGFTGVAVVTVGKNGLDMDMGATLTKRDKKTGVDKAFPLDAEFDIFFYTDPKGAEYTFTPPEGSKTSVDRAVLTKNALTFEGFTEDGIKKNGDGSLTVTGLTTGRHIIKVEKDGKANYQVITARKVSYELQDADGNKLTENPKPGDSIKIQYTGLTNPVSKLSGSYNSNANTRYIKPDGSELKGNGGGYYGVYGFAATPHLQSISVTIPEDWNKSTYDLTRGNMLMGGFYGGKTHRQIGYVNTGMQWGEPPVLDLVGVLPDIKIPINIAPESIELDQSEMTLKAGETADLKATVKPDNATDKTVTWESDNKSVATVDENGKITAVSAGAATITAKTVNGKTATCKVTVKPADPESVELDQSEMTLKAGETAYLKATVKPDNAADKTVTWESDNKSVATVDENGKVTAVAAGVATITAKTANGKTATCKVTVKSDKINLPKGVIRTTVGSYADKKMIVKIRKVKGAERYRVAYKINGARKWTYKWADSKGNVVLRKMRAGKLYQFRAANYVKRNGKWQRGAWSKPRYRLIAAARIVKMTPAKGKFIVSIRRVKSASGYQVLYSTKKNMTNAKIKTFKGNKNTKLKISNLKKGRTCYVRVRPIKKVGKVTYIGITLRVKSVRVK